MVANISELATDGRPFESLRFVHLLLAMLVKQNGGPISIEMADLELDNWHLTGATYIDEKRMLLGLHENCNGVDCTGDPEKPE